MTMPALQLAKWTGLVTGVASGLIISSTALLAASGEKIGSAVTIVNTVTVDYEKQKRGLATGDNVHQDELVEVSSDSQGEFRLDDETKLALGPGARLLLDKFVYDSDRKVGSIVVNLVKGTFRFMTGVAAKSTYVIRTPTAAITVRGTVFDVFILPNNSTWLLLHEGAVEVRGTRSACRVLDRPGYFVQITGSGQVGPPINWQRGPGRAFPLNAGFPFVASPPTIDPAPRLTAAAIVDAAYVARRAPSCRTLAPTVPRAPGAAPPPTRPALRRAAVERDIEVVRVRPVRVVKKRPPKHPPRPPGRGTTDVGGSPPIGITIGIGGFGGGGRGSAPRMPTPQAPGGRMGR